jgi:hypothetical protein
MIKIPDEVVEAAARGLARYNCEQWTSDPERFWPHFADQARAALAATLNAWPGMEPHKVLTVRDNGEGYDLKQIGIILPLPQEARDE